MAHLDSDADDQKFWSDLEMRALGPRSRPQLIADAVKDYHPDPAAFSFRALEATAERIGATLVGSELATIFRELGPRYLEAAQTNAQPGVL